MENDKEEILCSMLRFLKSRPENRGSLREHLHMKYSIKEDKEQAPYVEELIKHGLIRRFDGYEYGLTSLGESFTGFNLYDFLEEHKPKYRQSIWRQLKNKWHDDKVFVWTFIIVVLSLVCVLIGLILQACAIDL